MNPLRRPALAAAAAALAVLAAVAGCGSSGTPSAPPGAPKTEPGAAPETSTATGTLATTSVPLKVPAGNGEAPLDVPRSLSLPAGATVTAWARIEQARFETWTPQGDLLVSVPAAGKIMRLHPGADPAAPPAASTVAAGLDSPQGMVFRAGRLFVAETDKVEAFAWSGTAVGARTVIVDHLPSAKTTGGRYNHPLKTLVFGGDGRLYVDVASASNADPADRDNGEALIASYRPDGSDRKVVMTGVRNGDGLSVDPAGAVWTAVNQRDLVTYPRHQAFGGEPDAYGKVLQAYVNNHPVDQIAKVVPGRDLGWPYCNPDQDRTPGSDRFAAMRFTPDAVTNAGNRALDCGPLTPLDRGLPAHSAPLGFHFLQRSALAARWRDGAVVGTHGSNNHQPPNPGIVYWMPYAAGTLGVAKPLLSGFLDRTDRWGKPVDAVPGPDGALYVSDDTAGAIYRLTLPR